MRRITAKSLSLQAPMTMRSGFSEPDTALPSTRNSGLETTPKLRTPRRRRISAVRSAMAIGTVLLLTMTTYCVWRPLLRRARALARRSAASL
jgi:hypothetical protein